MHKVAGLVEMISASGFFVRLITTKLVVLLFKQIYTRKFVQTVARNRKI